MKQEWAPLFGAPECSFFLCGLKVPTSIKNTQDLYGIRFLSYSVNDTVVIYTYHPYIVSCPKVKGHVLISLRYF